MCSGCATEYHKNSLTGGYEDWQVDDNIFEVAFGGNSFVEKEKAEDLALLRCASLTIEKGFKYFIVSDKITKMVFLNTKPVVYLIIQCFHRKDIETDKVVHDAEQVRLAIKSKYKIKS